MRRPTTAAIGAGFSDLTEGRSEPVARGDRRRTALLESLDHYLRESSLDAINIADISRRAGVTRSAFYFYFENKGSAVAALMEEMYDELRAAAQLLRGDGPPAERIRGMIGGLVDAWARHQHLFRASLDARGGSVTLRELWDSDRESFVPAVVELIEGERRRGAAPHGVPARSLATVLLELNDRMLERLALGGPLSRDELAEAVVAVWLHTIYGRVQP